MSVTFKAFLHERSWRTDPIEIRRFNVDQDVSTSYAYLLQKINQVFPSLTTNNVIVAWTDADGDLIVISSDEELVQGLDQFEGNIFRLFLLKKNTADSTQTSPTTGAETTQTAEDKSTSSQAGQRQHRVHFGVMCDGCSGPVSGVRYKCLVCDDYDLCSACEGKGVHVDHNMVTINEPGAYSPWGFKGWGGRGGHCGQRQGWGHCGGQGRPSPCHGKRCGWSGGQHQSPFGGHPFSGQPPFPLWGLLSSFPAAGGKPCGQQSTPQHAETKKEEQAEPQPMDTEQPTEEQKKAYLHNIGSTVSSFLEPFGIKVDLDVLSGEKSAEKKADGESPTADEGTSSSGATPFPEVPSDVIGKVLAQLKAMGYEDEGGWLTELVKAKGGDIGKVLDALHYTETD